MAQKLANISVVFPGLNEENNLAHCLEALIKQTIHPKQIIFVNHSSTDNTLKIANSYKPQFKKLNVEYIVVTETKKGIANARNAGWNLATQPIICSLDSDCRPQKNWIKNTEKFFKDNPNIVAAAGKIVHYDAPPLWKKTTKSGSYNLMYKSLFLLNGFHPLTTANCAVKKTAFNKVGKFNPAITSIDGLDDIDLASRLALIGKIKYNKNMVVESSFRRYQDFEKAAKSLLNRFEAMMKIKKTFKKKRFNLILQKINNQLQ